MIDAPVDLRLLYQARLTIAPVARRTPLARSHWLSAAAGTDVYLKLETIQETGSFKIRGAANRLLNLDARARQRGVVTVSTGNHGRAVAHVAQQLGMRAVVCVPEPVLPHKVAAMRRLGAEIVTHGQTQDDAEVRARDLQSTDALTLVSPFDDPFVIAGQGTIGLELLEDLPQIDTVVVPLSGGGLLSGIALALKSASANIRVIGASMARGPAMYLSLRANKPVPVVEEQTLADSLMGGIGLDNRYTFQMVSGLADEVVLLTEDEIASAMVGALREEHQVVEGGGAVGIAALLAHKPAALGRHVAVIVSGGNVDMTVLTRLMTR